MCENSAEVAHRLHRGHQQAKLYCPRGRGEDKTMNLLLILIILLVLLGGGGFYVGGPRIGGSAVGLIILVILILALTGRL
jgi:hypothetical protein